MRRVVSLFSGCGGLDLGFKELGFDLVYACDIDPAAIDCYARNIDHRIWLSDVTSPEFHADIADIGSCDVVLGGFPCQGFSKAGPKNASDTRNVLYMEMRDAVANLRPELFIAENVDGISQNFRGAYLERIIKDFNQIGYDVQYRILDAANFGLAQHRRRIFFVGLRQSSNLVFQWPSPTHELKLRNGEFKVVEQSLEQLPLFQWASNNSIPVLEKTRTIKDVIADLVELNDCIPDHRVSYAWPKNYEAVFKVIKQGQKLCNVRHAPTSVYTWYIPEVFGEVTERELIVLETIAKHRRHKKYGNIPNGNPLPTDEIERLSGLKGLQMEIISLLSKNYLKEKNDKYDLKGAMFCSGLFKRPSWNEPSPTVLTNFHNPRYFLHPLKNRPFSLRECARLQGFPDTFVFTCPNSETDLISGYRLVGNAVPPPLSRLFAAAVSNSLSQTLELQVAVTAIKPQTPDGIVMRIPDVDLDLNTALTEFDIWITPSLGEIQDTERFQQAMSYVIDIFDSLATATNNFAKVADFTPIAIADKFINLIQNKTPKEAEAKLQSLAVVLFLATGKTDNNNKCQFPLYLRDEADWKKYPRLRQNQKETKLISVDIPRVLKAENYMQNVASLASFPDQQKRLLQEFIKFVLKDDSCISQLWSIGHSYSMLKQFNKERALLAPLVIFQIRGSVSASGGHKPETLLRERLAEWGLQKGVDYNTTDVVIKPEAATVSVEEVKDVEDTEETTAALIEGGEEVEKVRKSKEKTRAYDFVIPFKTPGWKPRIFVQCQFYAGDSGSVSHKNIDQTDTSRNYILSFLPDARFVEYVDGAGYFSSLNGDLKKLLSKPTTTSFFQVRSAAIRLRRELQHVGFLIPLTLEHAIICSNGLKTSVYQSLIKAGYSEAEIERCITDSIQRHLIKIEGEDRLLITSNRRTVVRRYFLLDVVAQYGASANNKSGLAASIIIPGYGPFYGMKLTALTSEAIRLAPGFREDWSNPEVIMQDLGWLCDEGLAMLC